MQKISMEKVAASAWSKRFRAAVKAGDVGKAARIFDKIKYPNSNWGVSSDIVYAVRHKDPNKNVSSIRNVIKKHQRSAEITNTNWPFLRAEMKDALNWKGGKYDLPQRSEPSINFVRDRAERYLTTGELNRDMFKRRYGNNRRTNPYK